MRQVLIINGHPDKQSYNYALSEAYKNGANKTNAIIDTINISDLDFNPNLRFGYRKRTELEPDLKDAIAKIKKADHIVWVFPLWWAGLPALMKGFIDRTFLPGITYDFIEGKTAPVGLLKGKTSRIIITTDVARWYDYIVMKRPVLNQFKKGTLGFCGIKSVKVTYFSSIISSSLDARKKWLQKVIKLGEKLK